MGYIGKFPTPQPLSATDIPDLPATKITSGTFPALNGSNLTNLDAADLTGTLPAISGANLTGISTTGFTEIASASNDDAATHVLATDFSTYNIIKIFWSCAMTANGDSLVFSVSDDNFSSVENLDGMYSYFQMDSSGNASNGNISNPNDGLNEQYIQITGNQQNGDNIFGETILKGGTFHSNGDETRRNQFFFRHDTVTHQGTGIYVERVSSHGQIARAAAGSEAKTPTHCRFHELGGANLEFSYRQFGLVTT